MKCLLTLLLALCTVLSVHCATETPCDPTICDCTLKNYTETASIPTPTVECNSGNMIIYVNKCQLEKNKYNSSNVALSNNNAPECNSKEVLVNDEVQLAFHDPLTLGKCGNNMTINQTHVTFFNVLNFYVNPSKIITKNNASGIVSCTFPLNYTVNLNTTLKPKLATTQLTVPGVMGAFTVTMALFKDDTFVNPITDSTTDVNVESYIYMEVNIPDLEANAFSVKVLRIFVSPLQTGGDIYNLTNYPNGCPDNSMGDAPISIINNGNGSFARFKMQVFKIANSDLVYVSADVTICTSNCVTPCPDSQNGRSSDSAGPNLATIQLAVSASTADVSSGVTDRFSKTSAAMLLLLSLLFVKLM